MAEKRSWKLPRLLTSMLLLSREYRVFPTPLPRESLLEAGRVTALQFANTLGQAPRAALLLPLLTPLFPTIARLVAEGREGDALTAFRRAAGLLGFLAVPITVLMAVYAQEISQLAFGRGECNAECVDETAEPLFFYAFAIWSGFASMLMNRTLSAAHRQRAIMVATAITVVLTIVLDIILLNDLFRFRGFLGSLVGGLIRYLVGDLISYLTRYVLGDLTSALFGGFVSDLLGRRRAPGENVPHDQHRRGADHADDGEPLRRCE